MKKLISQKGTVKVHRNFVVETKEDDDLDDEH